MNSSSSAEIRARDDDTATHFKRIRLTEAQWQSILTANPGSFKLYYRLIVFDGTGGGVNSAENTYVFTTWVDGHPQLEQFLLVVE